MTDKLTGPPGSHPHADRPNWRPAETIKDYVDNCTAGLETYSERRFAKLMGASRAEIWRWKLAASLPEELCDRLMAAGAGMRDLAAVALAFRENRLPVVEIEHCPHCGGVIRERGEMKYGLIKVVAAYLAEHHDELQE